MPVIGITGGIGTGKTTFCDFLREILPAAKFFDADQAARELSAHDSEVKKAIRDEFGADIYLPGGGLNRTRLRAIVLASAAKKTALEKILHPRIRRQWSAEAEPHRNSSEFFFADIPLLYETGGEALCERVAVVACSRTVQVARLLQRGSLGPGEAEALINAQMSLEEKMKRAQHVVWNNGGKDILQEQARVLVELWRK
jgi:dephospho-CoA kinase